MGEQRQYVRRDGFTLIELSIVLVIIGLIVGGIVVGQDLIKAAAVRATIAQIDKYQQAAETFKGKYGYLPGDIKDPDASSFGFATRGQYAGEGDGNGIIQGIWTNAAASNSGIYETGGETLVFWVDLCTAHLIDAGLTMAQPSVPYNLYQSTNTIQNALPAAKLGQGNYIYVYSGGTFNSGGSGPSNGTNYFGISAVTELSQGNQTVSTPTLSVQQAFSIDQKIDDGFPQTGNVTAQFLNGGSNNISIKWAAGGGTVGANPGAAASSSATSCYDNGGNSSNTTQYSVEINNGANVNCALSFRFQ